MSAPLLPSPAMADTRAEWGELLEILRTQVVKFGSKRAVAKELKLTEGRLGRILNEVDKTISVKSALRLSELSGLPPSRVLRAAGKGDIAELIEKLYAVGRAPVSPSERELLTQWESLNTRSREGLLTVVGQLAAAARKTKVKRSA